MTREGLGSAMIQQVSGEIFPGSAFLQRVAGILARAAHPAGAGTGGRDGLAMPPGLLAQVPTLIPASGVFQAGTMMATDSTGGHGIYLWFPSA